MEEKVVIEEPYKDKKDNEEKENEKSVELVE